MALRAYALLIVEHTPEGFHHNCRMWDVSEYDACNRVKKTPQRFYHTESVETSFF